MLDLETMSLRSDAAIVSIGAVKFNPRNKNVGELGDPSDPEYKHFYRTVDLQSCIDLGLKVDGAAVMWWLKQSATARDALADPPPAPITDVLCDFHAWFGGQRMQVWGNGANFDGVVMRNAYEKIALPPPYLYKDEMCYRTIRKVVPEVKWLDGINPHHALDDAVAQAIHLQKLFNFIPMQ